MFLLIGGYAIGQMLREVPSSNGAKRHQAMLMEAVRYSRLKNKKKL